MTFETIGHQSLKQCAMPDFIVSDLLDKHWVGREMCNVHLRLQAVRHQCQRNQPQPLTTSSCKDRSWASPKFSGYCLRTQQGVFLCPPAMLEMFEFQRKWRQAASGVRIRKGKSKQTSTAARFGMTSGTDVCAKATKVLHQVVPHYAFGLLHTRLVTRSVLVQVAERCVDCETQRP